MNQLQIFSNQKFGQVRTVEINGKPYVAGVDIARILDYANPSKAVIDHCKGITKLGIPSDGGIQETNVIPEGDIYRLIIKAADQSRNAEIKQKAEEFERWIFDEVLPSIRKTGSYISKPQRSSYGDLAALMREWRTWAKAMNMPPYLAMQKLIQFLKEKGEPIPEEMAYLPPWTQEQIQPQQINIINLGKQV